MEFLSLILALAASASVSAVQFNVDTTHSTSSSAGAIAGSLMANYSASDSGVFTQANWWESGAAWASMIHYWHYTGDAMYNDAVSAGIAAQTGSTQDFMGSNTQGNDDQLWWGIAAMTAAEYNFPAPTSGPSWLQLAQNVYGAVASRWDTSTCNGGLHWQISPSASGYSYKNAISNGLFFQLSARLARYTGDSQYTTQAETVWNWVQSAGLVDKSTYQVYDGTDDTEGCTALDHDEWSYNVGVYLYGAAVMLDLTNDDATWSPHLNGLIGAASKTFSDNGILQESKCESNNSCNTDQFSFKSYLSRWLATTAALIPSVSAQIKPLLQASVTGALASCNGGSDAAICGFKWTIDSYEGPPGVGQQLAALEIVQGQLASSRPLPSSPSTRRVRRRFEA